MISTILLSGGVGSRSGQNIPKQYCNLNGKRIFNYCLDEIVKSGLTDELIIVYGDGFLDLIKDILKDYKEFKSIKYTIGGESRQESVFNGLKLCSGDSVLLHESARPLITSKDISEIVNFPAENVTMGLDIPFTVLKKENGEISEVLKREELFNVQLPQKFNLKELLNAHTKAKSDNLIFTDDSSLLFHYKGRVAVLDGSIENIKVTSPNDFHIAESILKRRELI